MVRPRAFDEEEVLDRAMDVFCRHGYDGSTMIELTASMGVTAPSIYAAFGSKRGLFEAVLDRYADCERENCDWVLSAPTAREVVERLLRRAAKVLPERKGPAGCLLIQAGLAVGPENADVPIELARRRRANELTLRTRFEQAKFDGDLPANADAPALASFVTAVFYGLAVKAAGGTKTDGLHKIVDQAMTSWTARVSALEVPADPVLASPDRSKDPARGRPREFCKPDALEAAMLVFWRKGFEGASLGDLTEAMGIARPSLYAAFGNKELLFVAALDRYQREKISYVTQALEAPTAKQVVERMLAGAVAAQTSDRQPRGCLAMINSMQIGDDARVIRAEILKRAAESHKAFVSKFATAKAKGDLPQSANPDGLATLLETVMQGIAALGAAGASRIQIQSLADSALAVWPST